MPRKSHKNWSEPAPAAAAASSPEEIPAATFSGASAMTRCRDASLPQSEPRAPSCEPASPARSTAPSVGGKKRKEPLFLTELQEQDVAEWYRDNEVLYNKAKKHYKDSRPRMRLFAENASSLIRPAQESSSEHET